MKAMREEKVLDNLMLIEARAKQKYYAAFNGILESEGFAFIKRTKRPPQDPLNAMISFGNTLLYNLILQLLWKTSLDPRIGIVHAANKRNHSLNLDFADLFKPLVVDRVIFTLINCKMIKSDEHFREVENGGIYLSEAGKGIFIKKFEEKLSSVLVVRNKSCTYRKLIENELRLYQQYVLKDTKYKPYKYY